MSTLEQAVALAAKSHEGQKDKFGRTYILHPLRIMMQMESETEMIAAVLHDVVEDCDVSLEDLRTKGFSAEVLNAVDCLTHKQGESYGKYIDRCLLDPIARKVKIADLEDNMDVKRIDKMRWKDASRLARYHEAWKKLRKAAAGTVIL